MPPATIWGFDANAGRDRTETERRINQAFFAAHSITRTLGTSCLPLEPIQLRSVTKISTVLGQRPTNPIGGGVYKIASSEKSVGHRYAPMVAGSSPRAASETDV